MKKDHSAAPTAPGETGVINAADQEFPILEYASEGFGTVKRVFGSELRQLTGLARVKLERGSETESRQR